jgi:hypothetical protein
VRVYAGRTLTNLTLYNIDRYDKDGDGYLSLAEFSEGLMPQEREHFQRPPERNYVPPTLGDTQSIHRLSVREFQKLLQVRPQKI